MPAMLDRRPEERRPDFTDRNARCTVPLHPTSPSTPTGAATTPNAPANPARFTTPTASPST
ncbi:hypothetical protein, partial [Streptomyces ipomoeae]|uniref:hypothetical protein n=1 Tax=Streptomyces ipomoeae TaxID=103232 RepID=UPI001C684595